MHIARLNTPMTKSFITSAITSSIIYHYKHYSKRFIASSYCALLKYFPIIVVALTFYVVITSKCSSSLVERHLLCSWMRTFLEPVRLNESDAELWILLSYWWQNLQYKKNVHVFILNCSTTVDALLQGSQRVLFWVDFIFDIHTLKLRIYTIKFKSIKKIIKSFYYYLIR